jgi:hypothetical protein
MYIVHITKSKTLFHIPNSECHINRLNLKYYNIIT